MSDSDLDLSDLTDDQLVALSQVVAAEIGRRSVAVHAAAQQTVLDEAEKVRLAKAAATQEAAAMRDEERRRVVAEARATARGQTPKKAADPNNWSAKKMVASMIVETLGTGWQLQVWRHHETREKRVYLERVIELGLKSERHQKVCYYATGNRTRPPASLNLERMPELAERRPEIVAIGAAATLFGAGLRLDIDTAAAATVASDLWPADYVAARAARKNAA